MMRRQVAGIFLTIPFLLVSLCGCGIRYVEPKNPEKFNSARLTDPNRSPFKITKSNRDPNEIVINIPTKITLEKPCRVNYRKLDFWLCNHIVINGKLSNGKEYPVLIDSGFKGAEILLNDIVVKENNLETLYRTDGGDEGQLSPTKKRSQGGLCFLPSLEIGEMAIASPLCVYLPWHMEFDVIGIPVWQDKRLILGISMMSQFRYMRFDNSCKQLEFSYRQSFQPEEPVKWASYPFVVQKEDKEGCSRIMVDIPIAGEACNIEFDTGGKDTLIKSDMWEKIRNNVTVTKSKKHSKFLSYQKGWLSCCRVTAKMLSVGNIANKNAEILIIPEDESYLPKNVPGFISMCTFKDTSVVLDFEHNLLWIKNQE